MSRRAELAVGNLVNVANLLERMGIKPANYEDFTPDENDFRTVISKIRNSEVVVCLELGGKKIVNQINGDMSDNYSVLIDKAEKFEPYQGF